MRNKFKFYFSFALLVIQSGKALQIIVGGEDSKVRTFDFKRSPFSLTSKGATDTLGSNVLWLQFNKKLNVTISASAAPFQNKANTGGVFLASLSSNGAFKSLSSIEAPDTPVSTDLSPDGKTLFLAAFNGASLQSYTISEGGKKMKAEENFKFTGSGPVKGRQDKAAAHQAKLDPGSGILLVPDLGSDVIRSFVLANGKLKKNPDITVHPGCGPRHLEYAPANKGTLTFYLICELSSEILMIELSDPKSASIKLIQTTTVLPKGGKVEEFNAAEISITPDGNFLYATNRYKGTDKTITNDLFFVFSRDKGGKLKLVGDFPTGGKGARHFSFSLDKVARWIVVTNQDSNLVCVHRRDLKTGKLTQVASAVSKSPAVALFLD